ncbi:MAG: Spy/CpxP family protein refolding chaperone [Candidatus Competibacteraceae bacterium]|uniref:Zinc resistance-associated protein n=1 Tax=Candidatus Contendobacter odensis Run_B_J11 TaxID=1400861 RepID=A0A7U7J5L0_9GAMM|nr:Spy/CpxP family protein refolding chaperone [Candidatus Contendobacter odensis]MBK8538077.1 Spy/CpxP family protein refolding chaperone [Candidatus Competibacteraceae bacterium]CDH46927.1 exported hypothetical protein [Candidatus Contendobacter odensis Run_B_J11]
MKTLHKGMLTAAAVIGLGLTTVGFAGNWGSHGPMGGEDCSMMGHGRMGGGGWEQRQAMMQQYRAERMELLEARLKLKPEQQAAWKGFLTAQDAHHATMMKMREEMRGQETTAMAHFEERAQAMEQNLSSMKAMIKAAGDLYTTLDPQQKQVMDKFITEQPMRRMMRGSDAPPAPPAPPAKS